MQRVVAGKRGHLAVDAHRVVAPTAEHARDRRVDGLAQWHAPRKPRAHLFFFLCSVCVCMCVCLCLYMRVHLAKMEGTRVGDLLGVLKVAWVCGGLP